MMYLSLMPDLLGLSLTVDETIELATQHGFTGVDARMASFAEFSEDDVQRLRARFGQTGTRPGYCALPPGKIPISEAEWNEAVRALPKLASVAQQLGYERTGIVLLPFHETLEREAALEEHAQRLRQVLPILADNGLRLGLEYVAAPSRRAPYSTHTVWDMAGTLELIARVGAPNLGLMLDTFHWHGANESADDLEALHPEQVVLVHVADAPDVPLEEQQVGVRALPGETGVVDFAAFFGALKHIGYDGPLTCEPMAPALEALGTHDRDKIAAAIKRSLDEVARAPQ